MKSYLVALALTAWMLASCLPSGESMTPAARPDVVAVTENDEMTEIYTPDPTAQLMVNLAKEKLAGKFGIAVEEIFLSDVTPTLWPDDSLGCPKQGVAYNQVPTPGFVIMLEARGQTFLFHTDTQSRAILCNVRPPTEIYLPP